MLSGCTTSLCTCWSALLLLLGARRSSHAMLWGLSGQSALGLPVCVVWASEAHTYIKQTFSGGLAHQSAPSQHLCTLSAFPSQPQTAFSPTPSVTQFPGLCSHSTRDSHLAAVISAKASFSNLKLSASSAGLLMGAYRL